MPKPLPIELRERVVEAVVDGGLTILQAATQFSVGTATVQRWMGRLRQHGSVEAQPMGGLRVVWIGEDGKDKFLALVSEMPDATLDELKDAYNEREGTNASRSSILRALQRFRVTRKKRRFVPPKQKHPASRPSVQRSRRPSRTCR